MKKESVYLGIDIGGTNTALGVADRNGQILIEGAFPTQKHKIVSQFITQLVDEIHALLDELNAQFSLAGIGVAAPMGNYFQGTIEGPVNLGWGEVAFVDMLKIHFDLPIAITNDGNAAALGEMKYGAAKGMQNLIVLTLGTGVGAGIVVNGELLYGEEGLAGELGHVIVRPGGRKCGCGRRGCLETYVSAPGMCRTAGILLAESTEKSRLAHVAQSELSARKIHEFANSGDAIANQTFEFTGAVLGEFMANLVISFNPEAIILFGGLTQAGNLLLIPAIKGYRANALNIYKKQVKILISKLNNSHSAILGACVLIENEISKKLQT
ncbi:MAG: ROK family protein [Calditrichaeota bacterium]|nr:MAG: ROK family protein [Calditrichota bacterium]